MPSNMKRIFILIFLLSFGFAYSQISDRMVLVISNRVGDTIDEQERNKFDLFDEVSHFKSAQLFSLQDGRVLLEIITSDPETGADQTEPHYLSKSELLELKSKIDNLDHMKTNDPYPSNGKTDSLKTAITDSLVSVEMNDGSIFKGHIMDEDDSEIQFRTLGGLELTIQKSMIHKIHQIGGKVKEGTFYRFDPNYSRLMFAPTGRPLKKGEGYFSDYYVFFPGISYGVTNYFSFMAGFSVLPGAGFDEQLKYIAPRFAINLNEKLSVSAGALYGALATDYAAGLGFLVGTYGERDKSLTLGLGLGYTKNESDHFSFAKHPILVFGGNIRLSNSISLISENWLITGGNFDLAEQPFAFAFRFFGDHISADVGLILIGEVLSEGFPVPWLSLIYNFGN